MKHFSLLLTLLVLTSGIAFSQVGMQVGLNTTSYRLVRSGSHDSRGMNFTYNAGLVFRLPGKKICLQPSLLYSMKGAINNNSTDSVLKYINKLGYLELSVPVLVKVPFAGKKNTFDFGFGPYAGRLITAFSKAQLLYGGSKKTDFKTGSATTDDFKNMDYGLAIYVGTRFNHFNINFTYDLGLYDVDPNTNRSIKNRCFSLNMGVFF